MEQLTRLGQELVLILLVGIAVAMVVAMLAAWRMRRGARWLVAAWPSSLAEQPGSWHSRSAERHRGADPLFRSADVTDVVMNCAGGLAGLLAGRGRQTMGRSVGARLNRAVG